MTPPPNEAASAQPAGGLSNNPMPSIAVHARAPRAPWLIPAVALLTAALFAAASVEVFSVQAGRALLVQYIVWAISAVLVIVALPPKEPVLRLRTPVGTAMKFFIAALVVSTVLILAAGLRSDTSKFLPQIAALLFMTLPFFILQTSSKRIDVEPLVLLACHVVLLLSVISVFGDFLGLTNYEKGQGRFFGFLGDGVAWALSFPLVVYFCSRRLALTSIAVVTLALTGSRAPAVCVVGALILLVAFTRGRRLQYVAILGAVALVAVTQADLFVTLFDRLSATQLGSNSRLSTARVGLRVFDKSPLFGSGYNAQAIYFPSTGRRLQLGLFATQTSTFVQMLAEGGLMVFAAYLAFVMAATAAGIALLKRWRIATSSGVLNGVVVWLLSILWINQSAPWFIPASYVGPLIFGMAGVVSGYHARLRLALGRVPDAFDPVSTDVRWR